jgi:ABC-2 type transport system permease protein
MSQSLTASVSDSMAMSARSLRVLTRQVDALLITILLPVFMLLLFVYVFGGAMDVGTEYVQYVVPGIIILCAGYGAAGTAVAVASDMQNGVIDRFRSLPIMSSSVLVGHVVASLASNTISTSLVFAVAFMAGFRPEAGPAGWIGVVALLLLFVLAISWVATAIGLLVRNTEAASGATFFMLFLPYLSSAFVPTESMPAAIRWIAQHQPFTPLIESQRALLLGDDPGRALWLAVAWFGGILVLAFFAANRLFQRT